MHEFSDMPNNPNKNNDDEIYLECVLILAIITKINSHK